MKQAALITCHNIKNYGAVFQTYATTVIFREMGYQITIIDYQRPGTDEKGFRKKILEESRLAHKPGIKYIFPAVLHISFSKMENVFTEFQHKYLPLTQRCYLTEKELAEDCPDAELYISGSDQIWNSDINGRIERAYYLSFVPEDKKKISFASSFGKTALREEEKDETAALLQRYDWLTTREESGAEIIWNLGLQAEAVLDPTLWITRTQWEEIAEPVKKPKHYILVYQLHQNVEMDQYIKKLEKAYHMPCLRIDLYYHYMIKSGRHIVCPTPGQVITLIRNADYIVSDSFHMTVFAIIFHKQFISIYSKNSFHDRIAHILRKLNLESRHLTSYSDLDTLRKPIHYNAVNAVLQDKVLGTRQLLSDYLHHLE